MNAVSGLFVRGPQLQVRDYLVAGLYKSLNKYKPQDCYEIVVVVKGTVARCTCNGEVLEEALKVPETGGIGQEADRGQMEYRNFGSKKSNSCNEIWPAVVGHAAKLFRVGQATFVGVESLNLDFA